MGGVHQAPPFHCNRLVGLGHVVGSDFIGAQEPRGPHCAASQDDS